MNVITDQKPPEGVQVDFALAVGPGRLDASVVVPAGKVTLTHILPLQGWVRRVLPADGAVEHL